MHIFILRTLCIIIGVTFVKDVVTVCEELKESEDYIKQFICTSIFICSHKLLGEKSFRCFAITSLLLGLVIFDSY